MGVEDRLSMDRSFAVRLPRPFAIAPPRHLAKSTLIAMLALALLLGGWMWLRKSPLVTVEHVQISGVRGPDAAAIESALSTAARRMSTMDVHASTLMAAVAPYRVVREVRLHSSFPHGLRIHVVERLPVAALTLGATRTAVAADGVVLGPGFLSGSLPVIHGALPAAGAERVSSAGQLAELAVLGAAPETLIGWIAHVYIGHNGITVAMRNGLLLYFGDATRPHAKWLSAARVLADPSAAGASYLDVRLPERPAAGVAGTAAASAAQVSASDPTAAALAAALESAVSGGSSPASSAGATTTGTVAPTEARTSTEAAASPPPSSTAEPSAAGVGASTTESSAPAESSGSVSAGTATPGE